MNRIVCLVLAFLLIPAGFAFAEKPVPRTILAFYDSRETADVRSTRIHRIAEMPLNYLGLTVTYHDIRKPLPKIAGLDGIRGVITWFQDDQVPEPKRFIDWAEKAVASGIHWVVLGNAGVGRDARGAETPLPDINRYLALLGLQTRGTWKQVTYDVRLVHKDPDVVEFERPYPAVLPPFSQVWKADPNAVSYLTAEWGEPGKSRSDLVVIGPKGGYAAMDYDFFENGDFMQWYLNPFEFFRKAYATDDLPKPDPTTLSGRRMYYSHIDGDGWRNLAEIEKYRKSETLAAEVVLREAIAPFPDLPVTVAPIAADLDPNWYGSPESIAIAKELLSLPQVEAGSHTYSHPFYWKYFEHYSPRKEWVEFVSKQAGKNPEVYQRYAPYLKPEDHSPVRASTKNLNGSHEDNPIPQIYDNPRAYSDFPYDLDLEIGGSAKYINRLLPKGKRVTVLQWSGDTTPYLTALRKTREVGLRNINGGDTRLDPEFPSHIWVSPVGVRLEDQLQIYTSASNENTYTELWEDRYFGFQHLPVTLKNTETPRRLKPINIYYHMYSGQKRASLNALVGNLRYAQTQEIAPVTTSHYADIARGFFSTRIVSLDKRKWRIENRGALQTIRFDDADSLGVDWKGSRGVIGQRHYQGSLYVALDAGESAPIVALTDRGKTPGRDPSAPPCLVQSRWNVWGLDAGKTEKFNFSAQGFGKGEMVWMVPKPGRYKITLSDKKGKKHVTKTDSGSDGLLKLDLPSLAIEPVRITLQRTGGTS